ATNATLGPPPPPYLVTNSRTVAEAAGAALPRYWAEMEPGRARFSEAVLCGAHGGIVLTRDFEAAIEFVNAYAPEHLEILAAEPMAVLGRIRHAGEILLGERTPATLGNFVLGPNAVLPTGGAGPPPPPPPVLPFFVQRFVG